MARSSGREQAACTHSHRIEECTRRGIHKMGYYVDMPATKMKSKPGRRPRHRSALVRSKHIKLDQSKLDLLKTYFDVDTDQEAVEKAVELVSAEEEIVRVLASGRGLGGMEEVGESDAGDRP